MRYLSALLAHHNQTIAPAAAKSAPSEHWGIDLNGALATESALRHGFSHCILLLFGLEVALSSSSLVMKSLR